MSTGSERYCGPPSRPGLLVQTTSRQVGDDETRVVFWRFALGAYHLSFNNDAAFVRPTAGGIAGFTVDVFGLATLPGELARLPHRRLGLALQHRIFGHRDHVFEVGFGVQKVEYLRMSEAAIETKRVCRWRDQAMVKRWAGAAFLATEPSFRRIMGYRDLWALKAILDGSKSATRKVVA